MSITLEALMDTCTIQRRYAMQKLSYKTGTHDFTDAQTVTGTTSHATGVIERISGTTAAGYLILSALSGTFQDGEALTDPLGGAALADGTAADAKNDSNEDEGHYWVDDQTGVRCRFYRPRPGSAPTRDYGEGPVIPLRVMLNPTATVDQAKPNEYRIATTTTGIAGTYVFAAPPEARKFTFGVHHWEIELMKAKVV